MNQETIWNPREATTGYAMHAMKTGHIWRRGGKNWMVDQICIGHGYGIASYIVLREVVYLKRSESK